MQRTWVGVVLICGLLSGCSRESNTTAAKQEAGESAAASANTAKPPVPAVNHTGVFINHRELSSEQVGSLVTTYHFAPPAGRYWYDALSGAWGVEGREAAGFILPGYDFGPLTADASAGNTGVFINGREINLVEAAALQRTFGAVYRGRWWLDGRSGNFGIEGNPMPLGNLIAMMQAQSRRSDGDNFWSSATARGNSSGGCSYVSVGGATATSGCD